MESDETRDYGSAQFTDSDLLARVSSDDEPSSPGEAARSARERFVSLRKKNFIAMRTEPQFQMCFFPSVLFSPSIEVFRRYYIKKCSYCINLRILLVFLREALATMNEYLLCLFKSRFSCSSTPSDNRPLLSRSTIDTVVSLPRYDVDVVSPSRSPSVVIHALKMKIEDLENSDHNSRCLICMVSNVTDNWPKAMLISVGVFFRIRIVGRWFRYSVGMYIARTVGYELLALRSCALNAI